MAILMGAVRLTFFLTALRTSAPVLITLAGLGIFLADLHFPIGFAPWLPYFILTLFVARLYRPSTLLLATLLWSVAIMGEPFLPTHSGEPMTLAVFNRTIGVATLWILSGLLYFDSETRRTRQRSESTLQAIVQGALDAVVTMDRHGIISEWNRQAETIFGYSRQEAVGQPLTALIIPSRHTDARNSDITRLFTAGQDRIVTPRVEITALRKDGTEFPAEVSMVPLHLGGRLQYSSFIRDISERKQAENSLRETSAFIESMIDHLPSMVFVKDAATLRFVRVNKAAEDLLGHSRSELLGKNDYDFFPAEEADFFTAKDRETLASGRLLDIPEEPIRTKTGEMRLLHTKKIPLCDRHGKPQYLLGISEDVTEWKEAETALVRARFAAEKANKAKSDFLANMSHEMRTPLNAIMGISDYLMRTGLSPEQRELVQLCIKASDGLLRIIEDLLSAAKIESGTLELVKEPFILQEIVSETTALLATEANQKGLSLQLELEPRLPAHVEGDAYRLRQVLLNLIRNAIKFTPSGQILLKVGPSPDDRSEEMVRFTVSDTGIGIDPLHCDMIFDRFTQADSRSNRQYGGAGLGLSICKQLVALMGGRIWVESVKGRGSAFSFAVPLRPMRTSPVHDQTSPTAVTAGVRRPSLTSMLPPKGLKILLAEDSIESQQVMRLYLRNTPHQLQFADSGEHVVEQFQAGSYDLVFMDLQMPDMDGLTATRLIREWEARQGLPRTPIVALTANGMSEAKRESFEAGCNEFLTKPIKMDVILQTIRRYAAASPETLPSTHQTVAEFDNRSLDETLHQMKPKFLRNRHRDVSTLHTAIAERNFKQIMFIGHRMKGLAGSYELHEIGAIGARLEQAAMVQDVPALDAYVAALTAAIEAAEKSMAADSVRQTRSP